MKLFKRFIYESKAQWGWLLTIFLALILAASFEIIAPRLLGQIVDAIVQGLRNQQNIAHVLDSTSDTVVILVILYTCHAILPMPANILFLAFLKIWCSTYASV